MNNKLIIGIVLLGMGSLLSNFTHAYVKHCDEMSSSIDVMRKDINSQSNPSEHDVTHANDVVEEYNDWCGVS